MDVATRARSPFEAAQVALRARPEPHTVALVVWVALSLTWCLRVFAFDDWTPWFALLVAALPLGCVRWSRLVRGHDAAAAAAAAFVAWALLSAVLASSPWLSIKGAVGREYSVLTVAAILACWALGRTLPARRLAALGTTVAVAALVNVVVATAQVVFAIDDGPFAAFSGRGSGLLTNPVYFGSLMAGVAGYAAASAVGRDVATSWLLLVSLAAHGAVISGSRVALVAVVALVMAAVFRSHHRRRLELGAAVLAGLVLGWVVSTLADGRSSLERVASEDSEGRFLVWRYAAEGMWDRPIVGTGLGLFRESVQGRFSPEFARDHTRFGIQPWADPHNLVVLVTVSTGIVGLLLLGAFAWFELRRARGPFVYLFGGIAVTWLLQPTSIVVAPVAMLALGASGPRFRLRDAGADEAAVSERSAPTGRQRYAVYAGLLLGSFVCLADVVFDAAARDPDRTRATARLFAGDPRVESIVAETYATSDGSEDERFGESIAAARRAVDLEPKRPARWTALARYQFDAGRLDDARVSLERALELQPTDVAAWLQLGQVAAALGDAGLADRAATEACPLIPGCVPE